MRTVIFCTLISQGDPRMSGNGDIFDSYPFYQEQCWDFYEKVKSGEIDEPWTITDWINPTDYDTYLTRCHKGE